MFRYFPGRAAVDPWVLQYLRVWCCHFVIWKWVPPGAGATHLFQVCFGASFRLRQRITVKWAIELSFYLAPFRLSIFCAARGRRCTFCGPRGYPLLLLRITRCLTPSCMAWRQGRTRGCIGEAPRNPRQRSTRLLPGHCWGGCTRGDPCSVCYKFCASRNLGPAPAGISAPRRRRLLGKPSAGTVRRCAHHEPCCPMVAQVPANCHSQFHARCSGPVALPRRPLHGWVVETTHCVQCQCFEQAHQRAEW